MVSSSSTPAPGYSEERTVEAITSFYNFLDKLYLEPDTLEHPPEGGWPTITTTSLSALEKTDAVISLLRKIPYLDQPQAGFGDFFNIAAKTEPIQYNDPTTQSYASDESMKYRLQAIIDMDLPPHVICLANGNRDSYYILIDTERGVAIWGNPVGSMSHAKGKGRELSDKVADMDGADWWRREPTFEIVAFFEMLKERYRSCEWMPHPTGATDVWEVDEQDEEQSLAMKKIMMDAGWPGDGEGGGWDREKAEKERWDREDGWA